MSEQDPKTNAALSSATTQQIYAELLRRMGEDPTRDGLLRTPERMEKSIAFLTQGYNQKIEDVLHEALFDVDYDEMVIATLRGKTERRHQSSRTNCCPSPRRECV